MIVSVVEDVVRIRVLGANKIFDQLNFSITFFLSSVEEAPPDLVMIDHRSAQCQIQQCFSKEEE